MHWTQQSPEAEALREYARELVMERLRAGDRWMILAHHKEPLRVKPD
jgi:hypothetical protein